MVDYTLPDPLNGATDIEVRHDALWGVHTVSTVVTIPTSASTLPALGPAEWAIQETLIEVTPGQYTAQIEIASGAVAATAETVFYINQNGVIWYCEPISARVWRLTNRLESTGEFTTTPWHLRQAGNGMTDMGVLYRMTADGPLSPPSLDRKSWTVSDAVDPPPGPPPEPPPPASGDLASLTMRTTIDMPGGVTWTFSKSLPCGQYWNGDWFVHNAVGDGGFNVTSVTPNSVSRGTVSNAQLSNKIKNGLMRNPKFQRLEFRDKQRQGFDGAVVCPPNIHDYQDSLNVNPNRTGNIVFTAGQEGSLVKAVAIADSQVNSTRRSTISHLHILTVVKDVPKANAFRPTPDGDVTSKASIATLADVDMTPFVTANLGGTSPKLSMAQTKLYLTGPFMSPSRLNVFNQQIYGRSQVGETDNPLYSAVHGLAVWSAFYHIFHSSTSNADRLDLVRKICQIGLDYIQSGSVDRYEYWPSHNSVPWLAMIDLTAMLCDNTAVRAAYNKAVANKFYHLVLRQGSNFNQNGANPGTGDKKDVRFIDASDIYFRTPAEGTQGPKVDNPIQAPFIADQEPGQTPYTGGMIGFPWSAGQGNPNEGYQANHNMTYNGLDRVCVPLHGLVACLSGAKRDGLDVMDEIAALYGDRVARMCGGHLGGAWDMNRSPEWSGNNWTIWNQGMLTTWNHIRSLGVANGIPIWTGRPEQPFPPSVSKPAAGQLRMTFHQFRMSNNGALTGAQYRLRRVKTSNVSGSWQTSTELRNLVFYNTSAWQAPVSMSTSATAITVSGLATGVWQAQWRLQNASGWGPWSTNCAYAGDGRAKNGWPAGPRAVIFI